MNAIWVHHSFDVMTYSSVAITFDRYHEMLDWLGRPARNVPRQPVPPLKVSISRKLKEFIKEKYKKAGVEKKKYVVIHGIESDSPASMQSMGDKDSLLPIHIWAEIAKAVRYTNKIS